MLHIIKQSISTDQSATAEPASMALRKSRLKFLVEEVRTFRMMLDELKQSQSVRARS